MKKLAIILVATGALGLLSKGAEAWDSVTTPRVRAFPTDLPFTPLSTHSERRRFSAVFLKDAIGGVSPNYDDDIDNSKVLDCPETFLAEGDISKGCVIAKDLGKADFGWLSLRKRADAFGTSEHEQIAKRTAERAGLDQTRLFDVFWVRYASPNAYVASPTELTPEDELTPPHSRYLAAQSWLPTGGMAGSVHATRSVSLYEFAEGPDFANSVADWAAGAELCPLAGVDGAFEGQYSDACHQFANAMGAVNVTHFKPLNRLMWKHYHEMAGRRMGECQQLVEKVSRFTTNWVFDNSDTFKPFSNYYTEAHECEREAMLYEMWAQHFLQDAWATGHMWHRWGRPSIADYDYWLPGENRQDVPAGNQPARRAAIANIVGALGGMVHGDKSVLVKLLKKSDAAGKLLDEEFVDDPLNSPRYFVNRVEKQTLWRMGDQSFPGGGDLFWQPLNKRAGSISEGPAFLEQRQHLLNCGAKSMLETFRAGPKLFDEPEPTSQSSAVEAVDLSSDYCWGQLATNESMLHAIGVSSGFYGAAAEQFAAGLANGALPKALAKFASFPRGDEGHYPDDDEMKARVRDRKRFEKKASKLMQMEIGRVKAIYAANAAKSASGTESAKGIENKPGAPTPITMFGVGTFAPPPPSPSGVPTDADEVVPYVDHLISEREPSSELDRAVSRVFWRGNLKQTCEDSIADGSLMLLDLQDECVAAADGSGNPDACSECVYRAEALMPECAPHTSARVKDSKCSALGAYDVEAPPEGLPAWWFDNLRRVYGTVRGEPQDGASLCNAPFYVALQWCTGTAVYDSAAPMSPLVQTDADVDATIECGGGVTFHPGVYGYRRAGILVERGAHEKGLIINQEQRWEYANGPWLPPMITAYREEEDVQQGDEGGCSDPKVTSSLEQIIRANIPSADPKEYIELNAPGANVPYCGNMQRTTYWYAKNADCNTVARTMGYQVRQLDTRFNDTGEYINEYDAINFNAPAKACQLKEPRTFRPTCSDSLSTCNAGWQCVEGQGLPPVRRISPIDQSEADRF